jgi:uncharacterized tellurite resistance protein B-like protein
MIIFGTRGVKSNIATGTFHCPQCEKNTEYRHRKVHKFFTLYFIPIIPLGSLGEYVECRICKGTFIPRVLEEDNSQTQAMFMAIYMEAIKHSMVLIMLADGVIEDSEKDAVLGIINRFGHDDLTMLQLDEYVAEVQKGSLDITKYLKEIGSSLNEHGKEMIIRCALEVSASDGHMDISELNEIAKMSEALEMSKSHFKGIMEDASSLVSQA